MRYKDHFKIISLFLVMLVMFAFPGQLLAATSPLTSLEFSSSDDHNLIVGESSTISFRLLDSTHSSFSGSVSAYLWNTDTGVKQALIVSGSGTYSANNVVVDSPGNYALFVTDINSNTVRGPEDVVVRSAVATATGALNVNISSTVSVKLTDSAGNPLSNKSVTVDGTAVGTTSQTYTTLSDGTFTFSMTPTQLGTLKFIHAGYVAGTLAVSETNVSMTVTGSLVMNTNSRLTVKVVDNNGNSVENKNVSVDATAVGLSMSSYTILNDGTFSFNLTPSELGQVNLIFGGKVVKSISVLPAYVQGARIGGDTADNSSLSVEVAKKGWTSAQNLILTRDDIVADSMVAVPLAKKLEAPILMTPTNLLSPVVLAEIRSLGVQNVYIIGGIGAVSTEVENSLKQAGLKIIRLAGVDRYDTAAQVAASLGASHTVYLAYGYGEPDALAASPFAAKQGIPILLTETNVLPAVTQQALQNMGATDIKILGGTGIISLELENSLKQQYQVARYGGTDRFATEQIIFQNLINTQTPQAPLYFTSAQVDESATAKPFGDALVAGALAAKNNGFVVTLPPNDLPSVIYNFLIYNKGYIPS
ncbi:MAG: cell wall-binding repeat-containing protein, partial [Desulfitobacteriaceae bacterium]